MDKRILLVAAVIVALQVAPAFAYSDPPPQVTVTAWHDGKQVVEVDTDVTIKVHAVDSGFLWGIQRTDLFENGALVATTQCYMMTQCDSQFNVHHDAKGHHSYAATATDRSGNVDRSGVGVSFLGANQPPSLIFEDHRDAEEGYAFDALILAEDKFNNPVTITTSKLPRGAVFAGGYLTWTPDYDQSGNYAITFTATNSKGVKATKVMYINVKDTARPPQILSVSPAMDTGPLTISEGNKMTFTVNATDPDNKYSVEWFLDDKRVSSSRTYTYKPNYDAAGTHILAVRVYDSVYSRRANWTIDVINVNRPVQMNPIGAKRVDEQHTLRFTVSAKDPDEHPLTYSATGLPTGATFDVDTRVFEWTPMYGQKGFYDVTFSARDPYGLTDSKTASITVIGVDMDPALQQVYDNFARSQQHDNAAVTPVAATQAPATVTPYITQPVCRQGYLCYTITHF